MKVTVFGGAGFLGSHVCDRLTLAGYQVTVVDLSPSPWLQSGQQMIVGDILDEELVTKAVNGADIVFNFAGLSDLQDGQTRAVDTVKLNILGNTLILEACVKAKVQRYIFASTVYVYSKSGGFYRCSKQACELYIENYHEAFGLEYTILRYGSLYGGRSDERNAIYRFVRQAMHEGRITYNGSAEALREYIHVEDAAQCTVEILTPQFVNTHVILTGHQALTVGNLFKMISEILGKELIFEYNQSKLSGHYEVTPYSYVPKLGKKLAPPLHIDLGQGLLRIVADMHEKLPPRSKEIS